MAKTSKLPPATFHPVTELFPKMPDEEFEALVADIRANGQLEPIWRLPTGEIIDGRHRFSACMRLGIEPDFTDAPELDGEELLALVVGLNLKRRHLTESQRAMIAARLEPMFAEEARKRQVEAGRASKPGQKGVATLPQAPTPKSRDKAAQAVGVGGRSVGDAKRVIEGAVPGLVAAVDAGELAVSDVAKAVRLDRADQNRIAKAVKEGTAKNVKDAVKKLRLEKQIEAVRNTPPPKGKFNVVVADPPWPYDKNRKDDPTQRGQTPYPTMTVEEICEYPIPAAKDCILWLWCTNAHLSDGTVARVLHAWGFTGKTILTWVKPKLGIGDWLRGKTEHCILAVRGKPVHEPPKGTSTVLEAPVGEHSAKPDKFYKLVERLCPGTKIELFSRKARKGWEAHGAEKEGALE